MGFLEKHWQLVICPHACRFKPQEVANLFWALAVLKACQADTWSLLLDKLATVPPSSFEHADQHQLYQVYMLLEAAGRLCGYSTASLIPLKQPPTTSALIMLMRIS